MASRSPETRRRHTSIMLFVPGLIVLSMLFSACGSPTSSTGTSASNALPCDNSTPTASALTSTPDPATPTPTLTVPTDLITPGTLTVGSDTTYPPQEFIDTATGKPIGFDVDLITAMTQQLGLKADVKTANFDTIIDGLTVKRYDVVISAVGINPDRQKKADFVPYFQSGASLLVQRGNPQSIKCAANLCGLNVGVQNATVEMDALNAESKVCIQAGKPAINLTVLKDQTAVIQLLANNRVVATYQDSPVTDYYIKQNPGQFEIGGSVANTVPEGIVVRKGDTSMLNAMQAAFNAVKADGTYDSLFTKWQLNPSQKITMTDLQTMFA